MISRIITSLREQIKCSLSRFPLAYGLLVVLVAVLLTNELTPQWLSSAQFTLAWTFSLVGFLIALAVELIRENQVLQSMRWILEGVVLLLWMGMAAWASRHPGIGTLYMIASVALSAVVAGLTIPFLKDPDEQRLGNGFCDILRSFFSSVVIVGLLLLSVLLLTYFGCNLLFHQADLDKIARVMGILFGVGLSGVLFLSQIPNPWPSERGLSLLANRAVRWLFLPLLCVYLFTLYIYLFRILFQWELPDGEVAILVTVSMGLMLSVVFVLGPRGRVLPWLLLPLLALMTVGIIRRFSDYGVTVDRVYLALFNLWCYGVCLYLGITGCRRFRWVPLSFTLVLLFSSIGPWNVSRLVRKGLQKEVRVLLADEQLPMTKEQMALLDTDTHNLLQDKLDYLQEYYGDYAIKEFVKFPYKTDTPNRKYRHEAFYFRDPKREAWSVSIPETYTTCMPQRINKWNGNPMEVTQVSEESFRFTLEVEGESYLFECPLAEPEGPLSLASLDHHALLCIQGIHVDAEVLDEVEVSGRKAKHTRGTLSGLLFF